MGSIGLVDLSNMNSVSNPTRKSTSEAVLASLLNKIRNEWQCNMTEVLLDNTQVRRDKQVYDALTVKL